jgi:hypothetical protein
MLTTTSKLKYWRGSAPGTAQPQEVDTYNYHAVNVFKLKGVSDFASGRFKLMEHLDPSGRVGFVAGWQKSFLKSLAYFSYTQFDDPSANASCGYSLRIVYHQAPQGAKSTEVYFIARVASNSSQKIAEDLQKKQAQYIKSSLRSPLYQFNENTENKFDCLPSWLNSPQQLYCYEILKSEEIFQWLVDRDDRQRQKFYYSPGNFQVNKANNMVALFEQLQGYQQPKGYEQPVCIDLTLVPTRVEGYEKKTTSRYLEALNQASKGIREEEIDPDSNTQRAKSVYEDIKKRYYSGIVFLYSFRVFSPDDDTCQSVANQLAATCTANTVSPRVVQVIDSEYAVQTALQININEQACTPGIWDTSGKILPGFPGGPGMLKRLHRLVDLDEAAAFFRLPIPINQACAGVEYDTGSAFVSETSKDTKRKTITIGNYYRNVKTDECCEFDIEQLKTHLLVVGGSGSGKTTTTFNILTQLWEKHKIPFMVFDPKVTPEYRYLKRLPQFKDDLLIFTPGQELITPLRFNPFDVMPGVSVQEHISRIFDCFMGALPLFDPLPSFIQEAIDYHYERKGWQLAHSRGGDVDKEGKSLEIPTMQELYNKVLDLAQKNYGSDREVGDRMKGALKARLSRLVSKRGEGSMLQANRPLPFAELLSKPVIFELGGLNQEEQSLFSLFMLVFVFEYIRTVRIPQFQPQRTGERATDLDLRHVILVEEAHNMLGKVQTSGDEANSKSQVVDKFAQIMREMRAAGEGVIVVDQSPAALAQSIVDATNLKLMHRLPSPDDREYLGRAMCLTEGEAQLSGIFSPGEAFYYVPGWDAARRVATENFKDKPGVTEKLETFFTDDDVIASMREFMEHDREELILAFQAAISRLHDDVIDLKKQLESNKQSDISKEGIKKQIKQNEEQKQRLDYEIKNLSAKTGGN